MSLTRLLCWKKKQRNKRLDQHRDTDRPAFETGPDRMCLFFFPFWVVVSPLCYSLGRSCSIFVQRPRRGGGGKKAFQQSQTYTLSYPLVTIAGIERGGMQGGVAAR